MKVGIGYETVYRYERAVRFSPHDVRLFPRSDRFVQIARLDFRTKPETKVQFGRDLFDNRVGFGAAVLVQCLPVSGHILADGLSEAVFLLFATSALLWSVRALRRSRAGKEFALAGFFGEFTVAVELVRSGLGWVLACGLLGSLLCTAAVVRTLPRAVARGERGEPRGGSRVATPQRGAGP